MKSSVSEDDITHQCCMIVAIQFMYTRCKCIMNIKGISNYTSDTHTDTPHNEPIMLHHLL